MRTTAKMRWEILKYTHSNRHISVLTREFKHCFKGKLCILFVLFTLRHVFFFLSCVYLCHNFSFVFHFRFVCYSLVAYVRFPLKEPKWFLRFLLRINSCEMRRNNDNVLKSYTFSQATFRLFLNNKNTKKKNWAFANSSIGLMFSVYVTGIMTIAFVSHIWYAIVFYASCFFDMCVCVAATLKIFSGFFRLHTVSQFGQTGDILLTPDCDTKMGTIFGAQSIAHVINYVNRFCLERS